MESGLAFRYSLTLHDDEGRARAWIFVDHRGQILRESGEFAEFVTGANAIVEAIEKGLSDFGRRELALCVAEMAAREKSAGIGLRAVHLPPISSDVGD